MAWHYGTYSCGHDGRTNVVGPTKNRDWIAERHFERMCEACYAEHIEKERAAANAIAAEKAKEMELPELVGTEKQVAWAQTLRQEMIDSFSNSILIYHLECYWLKKEITGYLEKRSEIIDANPIIAYLCSLTSAQWFIDNRELSSDTIKKLLCQIKNSAPEKDIEKKIEKDIRQEMTVFPPECAYKEPAEIKIIGETIKVYFEKDEKFISLMKKLGYKWDGVWKRELNSKNGTVEDRAAELGNRLLNAGFPIVILNQIILQNAIDGKFIPECTRWVRLRVEGEHKGKFAINWDGQNDKLYNSARKLPGSKWSSPSVVVSVAHYKEVQDFANLFGFQFSKGALDAIEAQKEIEASKNVVKPIETKSESQKDGLKEILNSSDEVLSDLKD